MKARSNPSARSSLFSRFARETVPARRSYGLLATHPSPLRPRQGPRTAPPIECRPFIFIVTLCLIGFVLSNSPGLLKAAQEQQAWDGNRTTPVHLIPLKDAFDQVIVPTESNPLPFSARFTCAPCHDYGVISRGLHFKASSTATPGRPGEPWVWVDEKTGTLLPLSLQKWPGTWHPEEIGLSAWQFTLLFGRHLAGGGIAEPDDSEVNPASRWNVSGKVEINCMGCHNASSRQSASEWAKQILRQNFRWAATAAAGLGEVGGMASRLGPTWDLIDGPDPDDTEWAVPPFVRYDRTLFDSKHQAFLDITRQPADSRCLACHSVAPVAMKKYEFDADVHTAAGLACVSCHRHDLSHAMIRGYEGEAEHNPLLSGETFTCAGCHLGGDPAGGQKMLAGRLGAPYPRHQGFPPVHFKRLSCTACHSGPWPKNALVRVRTSRANRLGIYGVAQWHTDVPAVLQPVYVRDSRGKLEPHRLLWPAFWAERKADGLRPLQPDRILKASGKILHPELGAVRILNALTLELEPEQKAVLVLNGRVYALNLDGGLSLTDLSPAPRSPEFDWGIAKDGVLVPLIPDFDPETESLDPEIEAWLIRILEVLASLDEAPGQPALLHRNFLFRLVETYLEKSDYAGQPAATPELVWLAEGEPRPLIPEFEQRTISRLTWTEQTLTEEQVELVLKALSRETEMPAEGEIPEYVYISGGKLFALGRDGRFEAFDDPAAGPVTWPLAHEVRPARQSLGINGCGDCHRVNSPFLFRKVSGTGPLQTPHVKVLSASSFTGLARAYQMFFGLSFAVRPLLKWALFVSVLVLTLIILLVLLLGLGRLSRLIERGRKE